MKTDDKIRAWLYQNVSLRHAKNVKILPELCAYTPKEVCELIQNNSRIQNWFQFISTEYLPPSEKKILLLYPCSTVKPFWESRSYRVLFKTLNSLGKYSKYIHLVTISEPFGLVPEEFYGKKGTWFNWKDEWYDVPGLFEWWVRKYKLPYERECVDRSIEMISSSIAKYLKRTKNHYVFRIAFIRTYSSTLKQKPYHTHRRMMELAVKTSGVDVEILPTKQMIESIVSKHGRFAWDMYGIAHPDAQEYLKHYLIKAITKVISNET
ncbi:DUF5591 domain-containing protein [Thermococcus sp.]|uniref:DUF5591 domain-containing protein n=1 Tax=Thermococcus sp. TaxID=35749 RepID=UPI0025F60BD7|nr:DUF5591 domain-containing protein [Thermococcus sp.]